VAVPDLRDIPEVDVDALRDLTMALVNASSPTGAEDPAAEIVHDFLKGLGLKTWTQQVEPDRHNVIGVLPGSGAGPSLMLMGHLDTVWAGDEDGIRDLGSGFQPTAVLDGDWIFGMGAYNMKSGLASAMAGVKALVDSRIELPGDVIVAGVVGETARTQVDRFQGARYRAAGVGAWHLVTGGVVADAAIVPEPTNFRASIVSGGYVYFRVTTRGVPGATYRRGGQGVQVVPPVDALTGITELRNAILDWRMGYIEAHRYQGEEATNVSVIALDAGLPFRPTKVAALGRLYVEVDTMPGQRAQDVIYEFRHMVTTAAARLHLAGVDVDVVQAIAPAAISPDEFVVKALVEAHRRVRNKDAEVTFDGWMADTTVLTRAGIPALCYGPGGRMRQGGSGYYASDGEQCYVPDLADGARIFATAAIDFCSQDRATLMAKLPANRGTVT
jgi:acetylornithine deacetylase/succinyl-diaminopimelate desuccinylase-like protein